MTGFIKNTVIGGFIFLIPFVVIFVVIAKALKIMISVAKPISNIVPIESFAGIAIIDLLALLIIVVLCFIAGLLARGSFGKNTFKSLDNSLANLIPGYSVLKSIADSFKNEQEAEKNLKPVLVKFDDLSQLGFEVEKIDNGLVAVFLPGSPDTWSGSVAYMTEDRVERLNIDLLAVKKTLRTLGNGSNKLFD